MAEVRLRLGRGAYNIAHKTCNQFLLETRSKQGKRAIHSSALSTGFLLGDMQNVQVNRGKTADRPSSQQDATVGVSYTTETSLFGNDLRERDSVAELYHSIGLSKEGSLYKLARNNTLDRKSFDTRYRTTATRNTNRTFCTSRLARRQQSLVGRHLLLGHEQLVFSRAYSGNGDRSEPLYKTRTGYYDVLEVPPNATQAQIKTAYYKQSFIYHPDKNSGSEDATVRFSEISEAYNVLGNKGLRKKYDRGILNQADLTGATRPSAKDTSGSAKQARTRQSVVGVDGKGVFDFDKFIKSHYSEQLQRDKDIRVRKEEMLRKKNETVSDWKLGKMTEMAVAVLLAMALAIMLSLKRG
ncbi:uncharacterized protein [Centroberyx affinis]|uniref:uncharacterized protein n=1 Tax=Centroberyx affinis TaxID=166261 RepID=UPI003A5BD694